MWITDDSGVIISLEGAVLAVELVSKGRIRRKHDDGSLRVTQGVGRGYMGRQ